MTAIGTGDGVLSKLAVFLFMITFALPTPAQKRGEVGKMTVAQLEQMLVAVHDRPDAEVAQLLSGLGLTERLTAPRLARLKAGLPGEKSAQTLVALADSSQFSNLPAEEIPATPAPVPAAQRQMMALVVNYVTKTVHQLPNFFATRDTNRFEDNPHFTDTPMPLHFVAAASKKVLYRDGKEMAFTETGKVKAEGSDAQGLVSWGEFGPVLSTVLMDAAQSKLAWSHWEQGANGPVAVFGYAVPSQKSHYTVQFCCLMDPAAGEAQAPFKQLAAYHGEMAIDPPTGAIRRLTVEAEFEPGSPVARAAIMVEYGDEEIGGKPFTCPVKSVAISVIELSHSSSGTQSLVTPNPHKTYLNDVGFGQYHRLGSETRILSADEAEPSDNLHAQGADGAAPQPAQLTKPESTAVPENSASSAPATASETASMPAPSSAVLPAAIREASATPANSVPDQDIETKAPAGQEPVPLLRSNAHAVVVDVVVTKGNGEPVKGLGKQTFEVIEDGNPRPIDYFEEHTAVSAADVAAPELPGNTFTNTPAVPQGDPINIVLIDHLNTPLQDQARVHKQILEFVRNMPPGTRIAVFLLGSKLRLIQTFTSDSSALQEALNDSRNGDKPETISASRSRQDDEDDRHHIETHEAEMGAHQSILGGYQDAGAGGPAAGLASIAANQGGERVTMTLDALEFLARYLAGISGRKNLIWFSSSFPVSFFPSGKDEEAHAGRQSYDPAIKQAAGLLTLSKVAVYPVSTEGLQLDNATEASGHTQTNQDALYQQADARAIRTQAVNKLAADTGGKAFYNTNDLSGALTRAIDDGAHYYTLVYTPANAHMDGGYRRIEVKLTEGKYDLAYRQGYFADDHAAPEPKPNSDPLHPLLLRGMPGSTQILLRVRALPVPRQPAADAKPAGGNAKLSGPLTRYRVDFSIRSTDVELELAPGGKYTGKIQVGLLAYDRDGNSLNWAGGTMVLSLSADTYASIQRSGIPAHLEIDLPSSAAYLEAGALDWTTRKAGTLEIPLDSEPAKNAKPQ
jgi:VWFA-related protein